MYSLTYTSVGQHQFDEPELEYLLQRSREWNHGHGLTGLLLYKAGSFMQAIEGDEKTVLKTFRRRIKKDQRHTSIRVLDVSEVAGRQFPEWTMGYRRVATESEPDLPGYDEFLNRGGFGPSWSGPTPARVLLDWFKQYSGDASGLPPESPYAPK